MKLKDEPIDKRLQLVRALFYRVVEHAKELGIKVKVKHTRGYTDFHVEHILLESVKLVILTAILGCLLVVPGLQAGVLRTNVTLSWSYPTNSYTITNGTEVVTFTNNVESFVIYSANNMALNATNWPVFMVVSGTNRSVTFPMTAQVRFFMMTASNYWGETTPSNVAWTPPPPQSDNQLGVK